MTLFGPETTILSQNHFYSSPRMRYNNVYVVRYHIPEYIDTIVNS